MTPELLVGTRFGIGVRDPDWFDHRLALISAITVPSLLSQEDQGFKWVIFVDSALPTAVHQKLRELIAPFNARAILHIGPHLDVSNVINLARRLDVLDDTGRVLTGTIDDDDAWRTSTVDEVRSQVTAWANQSTRGPGLGLTFEDGLEWTMYDMVDIEQLQKHHSALTKPAGLRRFSIAFHSMSVFVYASIADNISAISMGHSQSASELADRNFDVRSLSSEQPMWLYCRHKQTDSETGTHFDSSVMDVAMSLPDLERGFGIDQSAVENYIRNAFQYGYCVKKSTSHYRMYFVDQLRELKSKSDNPDASDTQIATLRNKELMLRRQIAEMGEQLVADPADTTQSTELTE